MTRDEIIAVTESDTENCTILNSLVHEKLGHCWHVWAQDSSYPGEPDPEAYWTCLKCKKVSYEKVVDRGHPDYTHDISAAWAIKEWLGKQSREEQLHYSYELDHGLRYEAAWASPLDRCKAFLLVEG